MKENTVQGLAVPTATSQDVLTEILRDGAEGAAPGSSRTEAEHSRRRHG